MANTCGMADAPAPGSATAADSAALAAAVQGGVGAAAGVLELYNLRAHHAAAHPSHPVPAAALVGDLERELVRQVGGLRTKVTAEQKRKLSAANAPAPAAAAPTPAATATPAPAPAAGPA